MQDWKPDRAHPDDCDILKKSLTPSISVYGNHNLLRFQMLPMAAHLHKKTREVPAWCEEKQHCSLTQPLQNGFGLVFSHLWAEHTVPHQDSEVDFNATVPRAHSKSQVTFILLFLNSSVKYKPGEPRRNSTLNTLHIHCKPRSGANFLGKKNPLIWLSFCSSSNFVCNVTNKFGICKERKPG